MTDRATTRTSKQLVNSKAGYRDKLCTLSVWLAARSADADQSEAFLKNCAILIGPRLNVVSVTSATTRTSSQLVNIWTTKESTDINI